MDYYPLTVSNYDNVEKSQCVGLSNDTIRAYQPVAQNEAGFPTRVQDEAAIARYADHFDPDVISESELFNDMYSLDEAEALIHVSQLVENMSQSWPGSRVKPFLGPLSAVKMARNVAALFECARAQSDLTQLTVLDVNPGNGYLGALLARMGHRYIAVENSQALYLWQNRLLSWVAPGQFAELANAPTIPQILNERVVHIPWWLFAQLHKDCTLQADLIICDHGFGEMHRFATRYLFKIARTIMEKTPLGLVLYESLGRPAANTPQDMFALTHHFGWFMLDLQFCSGYHMAEKPVLDLSQYSRPVPPYDVSGRNAYLAGSDFIDIEDSKLSSRDFLSYIDPKN